VPLRSSTIVRQGFGRGYRQPEPNLTSEMPRRLEVERSMTDKELPRWIVSRIRGSRSEEIATVRAKDAAAAVAAVVKQQAITDPEYIQRLAARPG
jgi:hypothetical protein